MRSATDSHDTWKNSETQAEQQQQQQGGAGKAERIVRGAADQLAQHAARRARQRDLQRPHAQIFEADAAGEHQREADAADDAFVLVLGSGSFGMHDCRISRR